MTNTFVNLALMEASENRILQVPMKDFSASGQAELKAVI
jgi:hypothetical protein